MGRGAAPGRMTKGRQKVLDLLKQHGPMGVALLARRMDKATNLTGIMLAGMRKHGLVSREEGRAGRYFIPTLQVVASGTAEGADRVIQFPTPQPADAMADEEVLAEKPYRYKNDNVNLVEILDALTIWTAQWPGSSDHPVAIEVVMAKLHLEQALERMSKTSVNEVLKREGTHA